MTRKKKGVAYRGPSPFQMMGPQSGRPYDWIVGGSAVDTAGAAVAGAITTWDGLASIAALVLGAAGGVTFQAAKITPAPATSTPNIGRFRINEVKGSIYIVPSASAPAGTYSVGVAIYVADINNTTTVWEVRNPTVPADCSRDDYLFLEEISFDLPAAGTDVAIARGIEFKLSISQPVMIGGGQALHVAVYNHAGSVGAVQVAPAFRTRINTVA